MFDGLDNLQELDLSHNNLSELPPGLFNGLSNLQSLHLQYNKLRRLPPDAFDGLSNLQWLDLSRLHEARFLITHPNTDLRGWGWDWKR